MNKGYSYHFIRRQKFKFISIIKRKEMAIGKSLKVRKDDIFLVSYPRSGNTWLRFILGNLIYNIDVNFDNMEKYFPDIYRNTHSQLENIASPRYIKSHEPYDSRYPKVIYVVRDPQDVAISYYYWMLKFYKYKGNIDGFLDIFFSASGISYGRWDEHYKSWIDNSKKMHGRFLLIKYEYLISNTFEMIKSILNFLNLSIDDNQVRQVIKKNDFNGMQKKESTASIQNPLFKTTNKKIPFIRKGSTQQWKNVLLEIHLERFRREFGPCMKQIGYI